MTGTVTLVGGGPGDPELLTIAAHRALMGADVVIADRLGPVSVLDDLPETVQVIDVGKSPGHHPVPQERINALCIEQARQGKKVVRLKGGDPFVFGRGGEEVLACRAHGVPVTVIPGVSSALAVPALAGIPLTHRGEVAAVHLTSGHEGLDPGAQACLREASATVVIMMGVANLGMIVQQALRSGADPDTPVAIVEQGSTPDQRLTRASLSEVVYAAAATGVRSPAVIVMGAVAAAGLLEPS
ncbi:MAG: uroporphyrinogen-III C-methyltransferase [Beutenbergiaceae bacterium]